MSTIDVASAELIKAVSALYLPPFRFLEAFAVTPDLALIALAKDPTFFGTYRPMLSEFDRRRRLAAIHTHAMTLLSHAAEPVAAD